MGTPLDPGADEGRRLLERELARPEYHQHESLLTRVVRWLEAHLPGPGSAPGGWVAGLVVVVLVAVVVAGLLVWRLRDAPSVAARRRRRTGGLTDPDRTASSYRDEAARLLEEGCVDRAVVAAFRALVVDLDERGTVHDAPGRTAGEVAASAAVALPGLAHDLRAAAVVFDLACYGHPDGPLPGPGAPQRCTAQDARALLALRVPEAVPA